MVLLQARQAVAAGLKCWVDSGTWTPDLITAVFTSGKPLPADGPLVLVMVRAAPCVILRKQNSLRVGRSALKNYRIDHVSNAFYSPCAIAITLWVSYMLTHSCCPCSHQGRWSWPRVCWATYFPQNGPRQAAPGASTSATRHHRTWHTAARWPHPLTQTLTSSATSWPRLWRLSPESSGLHS